MVNLLNWRRLLLPLAVLGVAALAAACSGDDDQQSGPEVDRAYIRAWCEAIEGFRNDILASDKQNIPYPERNIAANEHFLDFMSKAKPPEDTRAWHDEWIADGRENLAKLKANDPSAAPDPLDVGPETPFPERLVALFEELPECQQANQPAEQPTR